MKPLTEVDKDLLRGRADMVARLIHDLPKPNWDNRKPYDDAVDRILHQLSKLPEGPATANRSGAGFSVHMLDLRATSTSSIVGALKNWCVQVREKAGVAHG